MTDGLLQQWAVAGCHQGPVHVLDVQVQNVAGVQISQAQRDIPGDELAPAACMRLSSCSCCLC